MLKAMIARRIDAQAGKLGCSMEYLKDMLHASFPAFRRFLRILPISNYRGSLPADAYHVARLVAARAEDCGTCVQIEVNIARKAGVPASLLQAVIAYDADMLPEPLGEVYRFVDAVVRSTGEDEKLRGAIVARYGRAGLAEMALAIGTSRFFPVVKRTMGYASSCALVRIEV